MLIPLTTGCMGAACMSHICLRLDGHRNPVVGARAGKNMIERLFISPGHNYFGHHGKPADQRALIEVAEIECVAGCGIRGDRFFDYKDNYQGQITFFAAESL